MGIEEKLEEIGIRSKVGLASLLCSDNPDFIKKIWDTGVGFIVLKTMMFSEDRPGESLVTETQSTDNNTTFYNAGTTSKEQLNFQDNSKEIVNLINGLYKDGIVAVPSIGTKETEIESWEYMKSVLASTEARVLELNLRYLYRALLTKHKGYKCNEYHIVDHNGDPYADNAAKFHANHEFGNTLRAIREIFPLNEYYLIAKIWSVHEINLCLSFVAYENLDAITLVNSFKDKPPKPLKKFPESKLPQISGMRARERRDYALELAARMEYQMPIFASGGVAMEAIRDIRFEGTSHMPKEMLLQMNFQDALNDIKNCFDLGSSYVQLGSVGYFRGSYGNALDTIRRLMLGVQNNFTDAGPYPKCLHKPKIIVP